MEFIEGRPIKQAEFERLAPHSRILFRLAGAIPGMYRRDNSPLDLSCMYRPYP